MEPRRTRVAWVALLLATPALIALERAPEAEPLVLEAVMVSPSAEEIARREEIRRATSRYEIDETLAADIYDIARAEGIPPEIGFALVRVESEFDERATSGEGARGLVQVMPSTARSLEPGLRDDDLFDRHTNLRVGFRYLRTLLDRYEDDLRLALLAYNRGPGTVNRHLARGIDPGNGFSQRVMAARPAAPAAAEN
jgi:soluble lytic murein transglycosylase-like protein